MRTFNSSNAFDDSLSSGNTFNDDCYCKSLSMASFLARSSPYSMLTELSDSSKRLPKLLTYFMKSSFLATKSVSQLASRRTAFLLQSETKAETTPSLVYLF